MSFKIDGFANQARDYLLDSQERASRSNQTTFCKVGKIAIICFTIVAVADSIFKIIAATTAAAMTLEIMFLGVCLVFMHDSFCLLNNCQKVYDNAATELMVTLSRKILIDHLSSGMLIGRPFVSLMVNRHSSNWKLNKY